MQSTGHLSESANLYHYPKTNQMTLYKSLGGSTSEMLQRILGVRPIFKGARSESSVAPESGAVSAPFVEFRILFSASGNAFPGDAFNGLGGTDNKVLGGAWSK